MANQPAKCDHTERVAVLENEVEDLKTDLKEVLKVVKSMHDEMTRYKGFLGGIAFVGSAVGVFWTFSKDWLIKQLTM